MKFWSLAVVFILAFTSCENEECVTCTKTIGGVAGNFTDEVKEVCDSDEAKKLEDSSSGTTIWKCE